MFCNNCGSELSEDENFCFNCGQDLSIIKQKLSSEQVVKNEINPVEYEEIHSDMMIDKTEDSDAKMQNLIEVIAELQNENNELKKELERYSSEKPTYRKSKFGRKMPNPGKDDIFTKFKKWYND